ncbi:patatin-like phospholipase family protein [Xanthocytophaga flava]|uniref:patatin-like phospholipase family protein n=1 Tax=Xanthocytophaga flava TaxID=3048013 RepID=UPI0028D8A4BD|nr:patatin-like phospholipase family protein [Xanthocytophaga flavus]MDJ1473214.1 patatin-like phospholipase family protein [Xanthocytophaga flavus]
MKIRNLALIIVLITLAACKTVKINKDGFAWKSFDSSERDQLVDLSNYASPNDRDNQNKNKIVIVCASGGGSRAAAFTTGIMLEMERISINSTDNYPESNVLNEIDYFSTVSGGGWGASSYIAYLYQKNKYSTAEYIKAIADYNKSLPSWATQTQSIESFSTFNSYEKYLANRSDFRYYKYQIPLILTFRFGAAKSDKIMTNRLNAGYLGWSYREFIESRTWPFLHPVDTTYTTADEIMLGDVFKPKGEKCYMPLLIANTTNIDNYKLVPFTPDRLNYWGVNEYTHYLTGSQLLPSPDDINQIPLASGIKASSGIPFALSSSTFRARKRDNYSQQSINYYLHLQDGGIIDQQGMHTAKSILLSSNIDKKENRIVFIIDASSTGIENKKKFKKKNASRFYNLWRVVAPFSTPDAQYALTRERVKLFEQEYNCTVVYLGTEILLDPSINYKNRIQPKSLPRRKKNVEEYFYSKYKTVKDSTTEFLNFDINERTLLYSYISQNVSTWFASNGAKFKGRLLHDDNSTAKIMFLAGRGVVQLKRSEIGILFNR